MMTDRMLATRRARGLLLKMRPMGISMAGDMNILVARILLERLGSKRKSCSLQAVFSPTAGIIQGSSRSQGHGIRPLNSNPATGH